MRLTHFGHACVLVEKDDGARALFDPGAYSSGFEDIRDLGLIIITHGHPDHLDPSRFEALLGANPGAVVIADAEAANAATALAATNVVVVGDAESIALGGFSLRTTGMRHAVIHPDLPRAMNHGFVLDDRVWHLGDAFDHAPESMDVLLLPIGGPWMKASDAVDFARDVAPRIIVPIHQAGLAEVHQQLHIGLLKQLTDSEVLVLQPGESALV